MPAFGDGSNEKIDGKRKCQRPRPARLYDLFRRCRDRSGRYTRL